MGGHEGITAFPVDDANLTLWSGQLSGVQDTVYQGLTFKISIKFPSNFPYSAPLIKFTTPCYHPNVSLEGDICIDILKEEYSPSLSVANILLSLQTLLAEPNNHSPLNVEAADLWKDQPEFKKQLMKHYKPIEQD